MLFPRVLVLLTPVPEQQFIVEYRAKFRLKKTNRCMTVKNENIHRYGGKPRRSNSDSLWRGVNGKFKGL